MAQFLNLYLLAILLYALSFNATSTSQPKLQHGLKSLHFVLYQHGAVNKTAYIIANGVIGPPLSETTAPFGTLFVLQDPMKFTSNSSSKLVAGSVEGTTVITTFDGLMNIAIYKFNLQLKQHKGSIIIIGGLHNVKPSDIPVVGGTGDFMLVQGYVTTSLEYVNKEIAYIYKIEFHLFWPPYAY